MLVFTKTGIGKPPGRNFPAKAKVDKTRATPENTMNSSAAFQGRGLPLYMTPVYGRRFLPTTLQSLFVIALMLGMVGHGLLILAIMMAPSQPQWIMRLIWWCGGELLKVLPAGYCLLKMLSLLICLTHSMYLIYTPNSLAVQTSGIRTSFVFTIALMYCLLPDVASLCQDSPGMILLEQPFVTFISALMIATSRSMQGLGSWLVPWQAESPKSIEHQK